MNWISELLKYKEHISIIAGVGTFISALVAAITVLEIRKQRESAYMPDLFLDSFTVYAFNNPFFFKDDLIEFRRDTYNEWIKITPKEENVIYVLYKLENIGSGVAKSIRCNWAFDCNKALKELLKVVPSDYEYQKVLDFYALSNDSINFFTSFSPNDLKEQTIDFIKPVSVGNNLKDLTIPKSIPNMFVYYLIFKHKLYLETVKNFYTEDFNCMPDIFLTIKFKDIRNKEYKKKLKLNITCSSGGSDEYLNSQKREFAIFYYEVKEI